MFWYSAAVWLAFASITNGECEKGCNVPTLIYEDLRCSPKYESPEDCCPKQYDCSHIYNRPEGTCHFRKHFYKPGEEPPYDEVIGNCHRTCRCSDNSEFTCPPVMDGCAEYWVGGYPKPRCYLKYELNSCCAAGEMCPPFDDNIKCEVNGATYDEGLNFDHPTQKCTQCVCHKGFEGKFEAPFCQKMNCTAEITHSGDINKFCAPLYNDHNSCCPKSWICPNPLGKYVSAGTPSNPDSHCKFGEKDMNIGDKYILADKDFEEDGDLTCECLIPPYLTCTVHK